MFIGREVVQIFDDDRRLRQIALAGMVADDREFDDRPYGLKLRSVGIVAEIDDPLFEFDLVFVERDQNLVAERCQRMVVEG